MKRGKRKKRRSWKKFSSKCEWQEPCGCGQSILCWNDEMDGNDECDKEFCPLWNLKKGEL